MDVGEKAEVRGTESQTSLAQTRFSIVSLALLRGSALAYGVQ